MTAVPERTEPASADDDPQEPLQGEVVRRSAAGVVWARLPRNLATIRERVVELAHNPRAVATATVIAGLAANAVRDVVKSGALERKPAAATPVAVTGYVVHHVHVLHHVVHHHVIRSAPSAVVRRPPGG